MVVRGCRQWIRFFEMRALIEGTATGEEEAATGQSPGELHLNRLAIRTAGIEPGVSLNSNFGFAPTVTTDPRSVSTPACPYLVATVGFEPTTPSM